MSWKDHLDQWSTALKPYLDGDLHCEIRGPANEDDLDDFEHEIGYELPEPLRAFMEDESAYINFWWHLRTDVVPIDVPNKPYCGYIEFNPKTIKNLNSNRTAHLYGDHPTEVISQWQEAFRFLGVPNGDSIALDVFQDPDDPPVVYLNHELPTRQVRLAETFQEFIDSWFALGCVGPESWNVRHFITDKGKPLNGEIDGTATSKLDITCQNSITFRGFFGLK